MEEFFGRFVETAQEKKLNMYGIAVSQYGKEIGRYRFAPDDLPHPMFSASKSFTSIGVGIAIDEGLIALSDHVLSYFPEYVPENVCPQLEALTVEHLLTMTCGRANGSLNAQDMAGDRDYIEAFLEKPFDYEPGTRFVYDNGCTYMLSAMIQKKAGVNLQQYLVERLFKPLGIRDLTWSICPKGRTLGYSGLFLRTADLLPFGQMLLDGGVYNGKRIVSEAYIQDAARFHISTESMEIPDKRLGYGYQFWVARDGAFRASGAYGQGCMVIPKKQAVVVYTSWSSDLQGILDDIWDNLVPKMN